MTVAPVKWSALGERGICRPGASRTRTSFRVFGFGGDIKTYCQMWELYDTYYAGNYYVFGSSPAFGNFDIGYSITPVFGGGHAPYGWLTHRAKCNEGGAAYIAAESWAWWYYIAPVLYESATVPAPPPDSPAVYSIDTTAIAEPGYEVSGAEWDEGGLPGQYTAASGSRSVTIEMEGAATVNVRIVVDGGGGTPAEAGRVTVDEASCYYYYALGFVQLEAAANPGFAFKKWSGRGEAYPDNHHDEPDLSKPMQLNDPEHPVTEDLIWIQVEPRKKRSITAHFQMLEVQITSAEIREDRIDITLRPETYSGTLELRLAGPGGVSHVIRRVTRTGGQHQESFGIPGLPIAEFTSVEAWWGCEETLQNFQHHFRNLGMYRHSQYNTPRESDSTCAGEPIEVRFYSAADCSFETGTLSSTFAAEVNENGSGVSISHGLIQREWYCGSGNNRFRPVDAAEPACAGQGLGPDTVARNPGHDDLHCGDEVLIVGLGPGVGTVKTVTDEGPGVATNQLDNYTNDGRCSGIGDLGNFITIKLY